MQKRSNQSVDRLYFYTPHRDSRALRHDAHWFFRVSMFYQLESHSNCQFDFLEIYNGLNQNQNRLAAKRCGSGLPGQIVSTGRELLLRFRTDGSGEYRGFKLHYQREGEWRLKSHNATDTGLSTISWTGWWDAARERDSLRFDRQFFVGGNDERLPKAWMIVIITFSHSLPSPRLTFRITNDERSKCQLSPIFPFITPLLIGNPRFQYAHTDAPCSLRASHTRKYRVETPGTA